MTSKLTPQEARIIGCLIEKEITTPEQYPLSLNALVNACNQKSNRDPVVEWDENSVQQTVDQLIAKFLINNQTGYGSRVTKYQHRFCNTEYGALKFTAQELGIICELLLRGPQTPGELRSRASRLCTLRDVSEVDEVLLKLTQREDGPFVVRLAREPGKRESRYAHLFSDEVIAENHDISPLSSPHSEARNTAQLEDRIEQLEREVAELKEMLAHLVSEVSNC